MLERAAYALRSLGMVGIQLTEGVEEGASCWGAATSLLAKRSRPLERRQATRLCASHASSAATGYSTAFRTFRISGPIRFTRRLASAPTVTEPR